MQMADDDFLLICGKNFRFQFECSGTLHIHPPTKFRIKASNILSFSVLMEHSVLILKNNEVYGAGNNTDGRISPTLSLEVHSIFHSFDIIDNKKRKWIPEMVVCGDEYTLYLVSKIINNQIQKKLVYSHSIQKGKTKNSLIFLKIGSRNPIALFGGLNDSVAIDDEGAIILIPQSIQESPDTEIEPLFLPENKKAIDVAFKEEEIFVLGSDFKIYEIVKENDNYNFTKVFCESSIIVGIYGFFGQCFALSSTGKVFAYGEDDYGMPGNAVFNEVENLKQYNIYEIYPGRFHTLFRTFDGKLLGCGYNEYGQIPIKGTNKKKIKKPVMTNIEIQNENNDYNSFCIAGDDFSVIFPNYVPKNIPNRKVDIDRLLDKFSKLQEEIKKMEEKQIILIREKKDALKTIPKLEDQISSLKDENSKLMKEKSEASVLISKLEDEIDSLKEENSNLVKRKSTLKKEKSSSLKTISRLKKEKTDLLDSSKNEIEKLHKMIESLKEENKKLKQKEDHEKIEPETKQFRFLETNEIDKLVKGDKLGDGGQSNVIKVSKIENYALKEMKKQPSFLNDKSTDKNDNDSYLFDDMKKIFQEYEILNSLNHPNIVKTFGFCTGDETHSPSILLEFLPYNLSSIVTQLSPTQKVEVLYEISLAMKEVHKNDIIHRDLKPENILVDENMHIKVSDFGISCVSISKTIKTVGIGSFRYMAPEILDGSDDYDEKVDVYSFGLIFFYVLTDGTLPKIILRNVAIGKNAHIPDNFKEVSRNLINSCLSLDPKDRPSFAEIVDVIDQNKNKII